MTRVLAGLAPVTILPSVIANTSHGPFGEASRDVSTRISITKLLNRLILEANG